MAQNYRVTMQWDVEAEDANVAEALTKTVAPVAKTVQQLPAAGAARPVTRPAQAPAPRAT